MTILLFPQGTEKKLFSPFFASQQKTWSCHHFPLKYEICYLWSNPTITYWNMSCMKHDMSSQYEKNYKVWHNIIVKRHVIYEARHTITLCNNDKVWRAIKYNTWRLWSTTCHLNKKISSTMYLIYVIYVTWHVITVCKMSSMKCDCLTTLWIMSCLKSEMPLHCMICTPTCHSWSMT